MGKSSSRGFSGKIGSGVVKPGDKVIIHPSNKSSYINRIVTYDGDLKQAASDQSNNINIKKDEIDCSRGQIIASSNSPLQSADQFETKMDNHI